MSQVHQRGKRVASFLSLALLASCSTAPIPLEQNSDREPATTRSTCEGFGKLSGQQKQDEFFSRHLESMFHALDGGRKPEEPVSPLLAQAKSATQGREPNRAYVQYFIGGFSERLGRLKAAVHATTQFLGPSTSETTGFQSLTPTFDRNCEWFETEEVKKVHALGTLAKARWIAYPELKPYRYDGTLGKPVKNPFSGLLSADSAAGGVPVVLRFSIANPIAHTIGIGKKKLSLEFIPGLGLKFLVDGRHSVDLVAMESLAGQGKDQNFFKYEFSPDFSRHAPSDFITSTGSEKAHMLQRYGANPVNHHVMNLVGKRFNQLIPQVVGIDSSDLRPHSNIGPHPFVISIEELAAVQKDGKVVEKSRQARPWRIVFVPALDNIDAIRHGKITDSSTYAPGKIAADFRYKLASLAAGDRLYYVVAETEKNERYQIGEIVLESSASPSLFADQLYFVQHRLDMGRQAKGTPTIVAP